MTRFVLAIIRFLALSLSYFLSTCAAAIFITFALFLGADASWLQDDPAVAFGAIGFAGAMWFTIAQIVLAPAVLVIILMEFARLSGLVMNLLAGGLCAFVVMVLLPQENVSDALPYTIQQVWIAAIAAGFVGGFTHWVLAGHRAGRWLGPQKEITQTEGL